MNTPFDSFVIFAEMRTGSNFLEANLNAMAGINCHGEAFNPVFVCAPNRPEVMGFDLAARESDPLGFLAALRNGSEGLAGFRYFHDHDPRIFDTLIRDRRCAKIILTRNPIESYVSWKIAQATGQWTLTNSKNLKTAKADFDATEFEHHLEALQAFQLKILHGLQASGQTAFYLDYEDINDLEVLNGLAAYLGVQGIRALDGRLKKQNPEPIEEKLSNPEALSAALSRIDRFNLSRTPNFEPRRAPMVPQFQAAKDVGLLHMPLRSGPVDRIEAWLDLAAGGFVQGFSQKELRQWKRTHIGHRSFSVIRHPLARAHDAFCRMILSGAMADIRQQLAQIYKMPLPPMGEDYSDAQSHREGFAAFLKWLRLNLGGQTGTRVDAHWASQAAVLQGYAAFQTPDLLIREERLAAGLAYLWAEIGSEGSMPDLPGEQAHGFMALEMIYDAELEAAARAVYNRDYVMFGFGDWRG